MNAVEQRELMTQGVASAIANEPFNADNPSADASEMVDIASCLRHHFDVYFQDLDGATPSHLHQMMLSACEQPLLAWVMEKTRQNQSLASEWLGMNRATLRKKLQQYDLL